MEPKKRKIYDKVEIEEKVKRQLMKLSFDKEVTLKEIATELLRRALDDPKIVEECIKKLQNSSS